MKKLLQMTSALFAKNRNVVCLLVVLGLLAYANSLGNAMFWDDDEFILKNAYIKDWAFFPHFFTDNVIAGAHLLSNYWRPLLLTVFALEWSVWKDWVVGWHAVNTVFHIANSLVLFSFLELLWGRRALALLVSMTFLVHPVQTEAVVYVNSLGDPLATFFVLLGLLFYARSRREIVATEKRTYLFSAVKVSDELKSDIVRPSGHGSRQRRESEAERRTQPATLGRASIPTQAHPERQKALSNSNFLLALAMFPLALMSKETGAIFPLYLLLTHFALETASAPWRTKLSRMLKALWPFLLILTGYLILRLTVLHFTDFSDPYGGTSPLSTEMSTRLFTFLRLVPIYASVLFAPVDLHMERLVDPAQSFFLADVMTGAIIVTGLGLWAWRARKSDPPVTFGILWFFAGILPLSNTFLLINGLVYEHWLYLPLVGIATAFVHAALKTFSRPQQKMVLARILLILWGAMLLRTVWRNTDWKDAITFYERLLPHAPYSYRVINNLGMEYADAGMTEKAKATYEQAVALDPKNAVAWHNLGNLALEAKQTDEAITYFEKAVRLQNDFVFTYPSLAQLYWEKKDYARCRGALERFFNLSDEKEATIQNLVTVALQEKNYPAAKEYLRVWLKLQPNNAKALKTLAAVEKLNH